ncbi:hypothetical protein ACOSP7_015812 [Xanthoceras sorbifolium]
MWRLTRVSPHVPRTRISTANPARQSPLHRTGSSTRNHKHPPRQQQQGQLEAPPRILRRSFTGPNSKLVLPHQLDLNVLSLLVVYLCNAKLYGRAIDIVGRMIRKAINNDDKSSDFGGSRRSPCDVCSNLQCAHQWPLKIWKIERNAGSLLRTFGEGCCSLMYNTCNSIITSFCKQGDVDKAFQLHEEMCKKGIDLNIKGLAYTPLFNTLIEGLCKSNKLQEAYGSLEAMLEKQVIPDHVTYSILIDEHCKVQNMERAKELFLEMHARNMMPSTITYTSLLNGYCKEGNLMEALKLRDFMSEKGIRIRLSAYRALITALGGKEEFSEAFRLLDEMGKGGLGPSFRSFMGFDSAATDLILHQKQGSSSHPVDG